MIFSVIEKCFPDWTSSTAIKSCLKNIKYAVKMNQVPSSQTAMEMLEKMKTSSFVNRLLIAFAGSKQIETPTAPNWSELIILKK